MFFHVLWMSVVQRAALFLVTWCVYRSFGLHGISAIQIVALQTIISLSVDMLPLPGGVGASEKSFEIMFGTFLALVWLFLVWCCLDESVTIFLYL